MISADHPRFSCTSDMSLTICGKIFSGPLVHTNDPSGTGVEGRKKVYINGQVHMTKMAAMAINSKNL